MKKNKGSFTIEAAILIPVILCMFMTVLQAGINFYQQSMNREFSQEIQDWDPVSRFYEIQVLKEVKEETSDD